MYFGEFSGIRISALSAAVPDNCEKTMDMATKFPDGEIQKFCESTGIWERYVSTGTGVTASDLCIAAAKEIFEKLDVDKKSIDGLIFLTQSPDYPAPPTSCIIQHRLELTECGLVFDSNIGCTGFPYGIQMSCAHIMAGCKKILLLVGDAGTERGWSGEVTKDLCLLRLEEKGTICYNYIENVARKELKRCSSTEALWKVQMCSLSLLWMHPGSQRNFIKDLDVLRMILT